MKRAVRLLLPLLLVLAYVLRTAGERDLHARHRRQRFDRGRGPDELPVAGEQFSALLDQVSDAAHGGHDASRHAGLEPLPELLREFQGLGRDRGLVKVDGQALAFHQDPA